MAISGHRSEGSLNNDIVRPSSEQVRARSDILSHKLSRGSHQSQQPSFYGTVFLRDHSVPVDSAVVDS